MLSLPLPGMFGPCLGDRHPLGVGVRGSSSKLAGLLITLWPNIGYTVAIHSNMQLVSSPSELDTLRRNKAGLYFSWVSDLSNSVSQEMVGADRNSGSSNPPG